MNLTKKEVLTDRIEAMKVSPTLKVKLQQLANEDRRSLTEFIRIKLEDIAFPKAIIKVKRTG